VTRRTELLMGGHPFTVLTTQPAPDWLLDAAFAELRRADELFSPFREDSAVSLINRGLTNETSAGTVVGEVLDLCRTFSGRTDGYFDAWATGRLDPCGLVKGWAIRRAAAVLANAGHTDYYVDGAGDVLAHGGPWRVGIRHPVRRDRVVEVLEIRDLAVATSGIYEKGPHIVDPHTSRPMSELVSLSVIGPDIVAACAYATAGIAMGRRAVAFIDAIPSYEALAIDIDLFAASTARFSEFVRSDRHSIATGTMASPSTV